MLNALLLTLATIAISAQSVLKKSYTVKTGRRGSLVFSAVSVFLAALFFLAVSGGRLRFTSGLLPYALGFAASYGTAVVMGVLAIRLGSLSLTSLVTSYSLIIPTLYGLAFLGEEVGILFYVGLGVLCLSLFLMHSRQRESRITLPWAVCAFLAFLGNGVCSTVQTAQQKAFAGEYKSEMMIAALLFVSAVVATIALFTERGEVLRAVKLGGTRAAACGLVNGACNLLVMLLAVRMNASVMFPVLSAGGILLTGAVSLFVYKERLSRKQYAALLLGTAAVVLMNL